MKKIIIAITLLMSSISMAAEELTVGVNGMVCAFCAQGIEKKFKSQPEISEVQVNLEKKFVKLTFKDGQKISNEKISTLLKDAGYEARFGE